MYAARRSSQTKHSEPRLNSDDKMQCGTTSVPAVLLLDVVMLADVQHRDLVPHPQTALLIHRHQLHP